MNPHHTVHVHQVDTRHPGHGHVLLILTGSPTDPAAATVAAKRATDAGVLLFTTAAVPGTGFSLNALLHRARTRRQDTDAAAITARVAPTLHAAGTGHFINTALLRLPYTVGHPSHLPAAAVQRLARNLDAAQVITTLPLKERLDGLTPTTRIDTATKAGRETYQTPRHQGPES